MAQGKKRTKSLFVVLNGKKCGDADFRSAVQHLREEGHTVEVRVTYEDGDTDRYVKEALERDDVDVMVAAGGDGSVNEMAGALVRADAPSSTALAVVPMGTANDYATAAGISSDPWEALQLAVHDTAHPIDIGRVNGEVFVNVATGGFGTEITAQTDEGLKKKLGGAAYLLTGLSKPGCVRARDAVGRIPLDALHKEDDVFRKIDAEEGGGFKQARASDGSPAAEFQGGLLVLAVGVSRQAGGGQQLCPDALLDDGMLDVSYVLDVGVDNVIKRFFGGGEPSDDAAPESIGTLRCKWVEVDCPDGLQVNRDGEPMRDKRFRFEVLPKRLRLHLPDTALLADGGEPVQLPADGGPAAEPDVNRTTAQRSFEDKLRGSLNRKRAEGRGVTRARAVASATAGYALAFAGGAAAGVWAVHKRAFGLGRR